MISFPEQIEDFSTQLLQQEHFFSKDQPIINFIPKQSPDQKKTRICAWNQHPYDESYNNTNHISISPGFQHQKQRIQDFLSTIRIKNGEFSRIPYKFRAKKKSIGFDNIETQKSDFFLPLNNTIITFPKSRSQSRKLQNQQKIILQKLYRKRQKSKIIPKQIFINPVVAQSTIKPVYPAKNYLSKNRSFVEQHSLTKVYNPESKTIKEILGLKRRFSSSYYKNITGVFQINKRPQNLLNFDKKNLQVDRKFQTIDATSNKINYLNDEIDNASPSKLYKTLYNSPKFNNLNYGFQKQFSLVKIREDAKNSHLNRTKLLQNNEIQLLGSTITKWKNRAQQKLKKSDLHKD